MADESEASFTPCASAQALTVVFPPSALKAIRSRAAAVVRPSGLGSLGGGGALGGRAFLAAYSRLLRTRVLCSGRKMRSIRARVSESKA